VYVFQEDGGALSGGASDDSARAAGPSKKRARVSDGDIESDE